VLQNQRTALKLDDRFSLDQDGRSFSVEIGDEAGFGLQQISGNTALESATSMPFTHTPPVLRKMAEPVSAAISDSGNRMIISQETKLREADTLIPTLNWHTVLREDRSGREPHRLLALWMLRAKVTSDRPRHFSASGVTDSGMLGNMFLMKLNR